MIAEPLNDRSCLEKVTHAAVIGALRTELRDIASHFESTSQLVGWIRGLPQRNDDGKNDGAPRIDCDVSQRARVVADDPNCVERSILYLAAAELIDPGPTRQLATIDTPIGRHTFPVENGEPVVLDPQMTRNGLRAGLWLIQNGSPQDVTPLEPEPRELLAWLVELAEEVAECKQGSQGQRRVARAERAFARLLQGRPISQRQRADVLYTLRCAAEAAPLFGEAGELGLRAARRGVAKLLARQLEEQFRRRNISFKRLGYWAGKAAATYFGVGGLYDLAYAAAQEEMGKSAAAVPKPLPPPPGGLLPAPRKEVRVVDRKITPKPTAQEPARTEPVPIPGSLDALKT